MLRSSARTLSSFLFLVLPLAWSTVCIAEDGSGDGVDAESALRVWTDTTGVFQVDATFVSYSDGKVNLRRFDGQLLTVELSRLSTPDREYVRNKLKEATLAKGKTAEPKAADAERGGSPSGDVPRRTGAPDPHCPICRGVGLVPHKEFEPYVHMEGEPPPDPALSICGRYCPACQFGKDPLRLLTAEAERFKTADQSHKEWERRLQIPLTRIETHQLVIHAQVAPAEGRRVAQAIEALTQYLQTLTGNLVLTPRRPDTDDLFLFVYKEAYDRLLGYLEKDARYSRVNFDHLRTLQGATVGRTSLLYRPPTVPIEHMAVHGSASRQIQLAAGDQAPVWLSEGFAAHCEFAVLKRNLIHSIEAQSADVRLAPNWDEQIRQLARLDKLRSWDEMFTKELAEYEMVHFLESKSMAAFLLRDPEKFLDLVAAFADGADAPTALERSYGKPAADLEKDWIRWLKSR